MAQLLHHWRSDGRLHTCPNTQDNPSTNEHSQTVGESVDHSTSDADHGSSQKSHPATEAIGQERSEIGSRDLCYRSSGAAYDETKGLMEPTQVERSANQSEDVSLRSIEVLLPSWDSLKTIE